MPVYDALWHLEEYFPCLFPYGCGGPSSIAGGITLQEWMQHAIEVSGSIFAKDVDFLFFVNAVLRKKRLSGLAAHAGIANDAKIMLEEIRKGVVGNDGGSSDADIEARINGMIRSGRLSASFETLKGAPAFWRQIKKDAWSYLTSFGACQVFMTLSAADTVDPNVCMAADPSLTREDALKLTAKERGELLAKNPVAASKSFQRRIDALLNHVLFGKSQPFGKVIAYLGRIEQQARHSPHLHILLWLERKCPAVDDLEINYDRAVADFIELYCSAILPGESLRKSSDAKEARQLLPVPVIQINSEVEQPAEQTNSRSTSAMAKYSILGKAVNTKQLGGSGASNLEYKNLLRSTNAHRCTKYCGGDRGRCRFFYPMRPQERGSIAITGHEVNKSRFVSLVPRNNTNINATHPMVAAGFHSNSDVATIFGNGIGASCHVLSYGVKLEKEQYVSSSLMRQLRNMNDDRRNDDAKLLSTIATNAEAARVVGAQEVSQNLLRNPLVHRSAKVLQITTSVLLKAPGAMNEKEAALEQYRRDQWVASNKSVSLMAHIDKDANAQMVGQSLTMQAC
eukprot:Plantae.Rhodophyta-Hildenbrandia_rubra.ctg21115.p1 GENE.Plantae.Rhodophyta-Hildenbrandia_rubra.ctg21115~~Plantae.Rhodophyta-Hildenbrandia_rubra.ctg21115.p1  ORF type:complete len:567 (+),score=72.75 Plantae.Rhodophyta-Hildenbrandia_rubra.ctg21115:1595-3295(+)